MYKTHSQKRCHSHGLEVLLLSPVASPRGMGGSGPPTYVQTPPEISANPLKRFLYIGVPMYVYCNFYCSPAKKIGLDPPLFGLATPLGSLSLSLSLSRVSSF